MCARLNPSGVLPVLGDPGLAVPPFSVDTSLLVRSQ